MGLPEAGPQSLGKRRRCQALPTVSASFIVNLRQRWPGVRVSRVSQMLLTSLVSSSAMTEGDTPRMRSWSHYHQKRRSTSIGRPKGCRCASSLVAPARLTT